MELIVLIIGIVSLLLSIGFWRGGRSYYKTAKYMEGQTDALWKKITDKVSELPQRGDHEM